jgi:hypothetical protein
MTNTIQVADAIDRIAINGRVRERPELDVSPIDVIGRISRLSRLLEKSIEEAFASFGLGRGGFGTTELIAALDRGRSAVAHHQRVLLRAIAACDENRVVGERRLSR